MTDMSRVLRVLNAALISIAVALFITPASKGATARRHAPPAIVHVIADSGPLSSDDVMQLAREEFAFKPVDSFARPLDLSRYVGRQFRVVIPLNDNRQSWGMSDKKPFSLYDPADQELTLDAPVDWFTDAVWSTSAFEADAMPFRGLDLLDARRRSGSYVAGNALGATTVVSDIETLKVAIAVQVRSHSNEIGSLPGNPMFAYEAKRAMMPDVARAITPYLALVVEGVVASAAGVNSMVCGFESAEPTMSIPSDKGGRVCALLAKVDRVAFIDDRTGSELASWDTGKK